MVIAARDFLHQFSDLTIVLLICRTRTALLQILCTCSMNVEFTVGTMITLWADTPQYVLTVVAARHLVVRLQMQIVPEDRLLSVLCHQTTLEALLAAHEVMHLIDRATRVRARHEEPLQHRRQGRAERRLLGILFR
uniref:Putative secreted protein n=1 Tax=Anopheles darlingi TaxID=43151 RepID=A0A2M4DKV5_ANODA